MALKALVVAGLLVSLLAITPRAAGATQAMEQCGEAKLSVLFWDVYQSRLYTPTGSYEAGTLPLKLEIQYLRDIKARDLVKQTKKEWQAQGIESPRHESWLATLLKIWPDVGKNDVITLMVDAAGASTFYFNDSEIGVIDAPEFGQDFAGIWLSPDTTRPELREALIGAPQGD